MRDFTKIKAWILADDLTVAVYEQTRSFPSEELYGLTSQLRRAAYSVPANIAEGSARDSKREYLHFLYIARGSLAETKYFIHLAQRLGFLSATESGRLSEHAQSTFACMHGLIQAVEKEAGKLARIGAVATSLVVVALMRFVPKVSGL
jgi:four helix bundle protein